MKKVFFLCSLIFVISCKNKQKISYHSGGNYPIQDTSFSTSALDSIIYPYQIKINEEMNQVIGSVNETMSSFAPESSLSNFVADIAFQKAVLYSNENGRFITKNNSFGLLNFGGIRAPINKGDITIGNVFELMPFDNEIVIVKISPQKVKDLLMYLFENKGQPIANAKAYLSSNVGKIEIGKDYYDFNSDIYIVTSDYLASGGDNMLFFEEPLEYIKTGVLIRDAIIERIKIQKEILAPKTEGRIQFIK